MSHGKAEVLTHLPLRHTLGCRAHPAPLDQNLPKAGLSTLLFKRLQK